MIGIEDSFSASSEPRPSQDALSAEAFKPCPLNPDTLVKAHICPAMQFASSQ